MPFWSIDREKKIKTTEHTEDTKRGDLSCLPCVFALVTWWTGLKERFVIFALPLRLKRSGRLASPVLLRGGRMQVSGARTAAGFLVAMGFAIVPLVLWQYRDT